MGSRFDSLRLDSKSSADPFDGLCLSSGGQPIRSDYVQTLSAEVTTSQQITTPFNGETFFGGILYDYSDDLDYWSLRQRCAETFRRNHYARGLIRRLVTNVVNTGLVLESVLDERILGLSPTASADWSDNVESRYEIRNNTASMCDADETNSHYTMQQIAYREALIEGDILCVLVGTEPKLKLISGSSVQTPPNLMLKDNIVEGVELKNGRHVAYHVLQNDGTYERILARGEKTNRLQAWLFYANDKRFKDVRGEPFLSISLQSLKEIHKHRDAAQRKAGMASKVVGFISRDEAAALKSSVFAGGNGAVKTQGYQVQQGTTPESKPYKMSEIANGIFVENLNAGEKINMVPNGTDINFSGFEDAMLRSIAWTNEIPPEILLQSFNSNYSASQGAKEEFNSFLNVVRSHMGATFCAPIYCDWLINQHAKRKLVTPGFISDYFNEDKTRLGAWLNADWSGAIKPSADILKTAKGYALLVDRGFISNGRAARSTTGTKFSKNMQLIEQENKLRVKAATPLAEFKLKYGEKIAEQAIAETAKNNDDLIAEIVDSISSIDKASEES